MNLRLTLITCTGLWLAAAIALVASGALAAAPLPAPQLLIAALTGTLLALYCKSTRFRAWVDTLPTQLLVLVHACRFVGLYFILMYACGQLPYEFAVPAGLGDICIASTAIMIAAMPTNTKASSLLYQTWNALGLLDILLVVVTAGWFSTMNPSSMAPLTRLPGSLLPTFLVPVIIGTHVILLLRLQRDSRANSETVLTVRAD
jgi:hypothetical protein